MVWIVVTVGAIGLGACSTPQSPGPDPGPPPPAYTGPRYLYNTVGSLTSLRGYEATLVSGYGLVWDLPGTGSSEVPSFLRQWLITQMRKQGAGDITMNAEFLRPNAVLADIDSAVVELYGVIPPGATEGTKFDVLVQAMAGTQTTSLQGGVLPNFELSVNGADPALRFTRSLAVARGATYVHPQGLLSGATSESGTHGAGVADQDASEPSQAMSSDEDPSDAMSPDEDASDAMSPDEDASIRLARQAVILSGGTVLKDQPLSLRLNQPSWTRSRLIADRINQRFGTPGGTRFKNTAIAQNENTIDLTVPPPYRNDPARFLSLIQHLYLQRSMNFDVQQAQRLADLLVADPNDPQKQRAVPLAWEALGRPTIAVISNYYRHELMPVRLAALSAGAHLGDTGAAAPLVDLAEHPDPAVRQTAASLLGTMPDQLSGLRGLHQMVNDDNLQVRLAAYRSLARSGDPRLHRVVFKDDQQVKLVLDLVPSDEPLIYLSQQGVPRIAVFNYETTFRFPVWGRAWDARLMIRGESDDQPLEVYFQPRDQIKGKKLKIAPTVANLIFLLAHRSSPQNPAEGFDLTYGDVVDAIYQLHADGAIAAPIHLQASPLADRVQQMQQEATQQRPETAAPLQTPDQPAPTDRP